MWYLSELDSWWGKKALSVCIRSFYKSLIYLACDWCWTLSVNNEPNIDHQRPCLEKHKCPSSMILDSVSLWNGNVAAIFCSHSCYFLFRSGLWSRCGGHVLISNIGASTGGFRRWIHWICSSPQLWHLWCRSDRQTNKSNSPIWYMLMSVWISLRSIWIHAQFKISLCDLRQVSWLRVLQTRKVSTIVERT
jgi:hypothetical protein